MIKIQLVGIVLDFSFRYFKGTQMLGVKMLCANLEGANLKVGKC